MHVFSNPVHRGGPVQPGHGRPALTGNPKTDAATTPSATDPVDVVSISDQAKAAFAGHGKSAQSPAHRARALFAEQIASGASTTDVKFGQVVSQLARGLDAEGLFAPPPVAEGEGDGVADAGAVVVDETAPAAGGDAVVTDDGTATNEGEIVPTEENTAATGDGTTVAGDIGEIAAIIEPIDGADLLDLLSNDEEDATEEVV